MNSLKSWAADAELTVRRQLAQFESSSTTTSTTSTTSTSTTLSSTSTSNQDENNDVSQLFSSMTYRQRVMAFAATFAFGLFCEFLAVTVFLLRPTKFAKLYTLGNIALFASTLFVVGWQRQIRNMADPSRAVASIVFVLAMLLTLYCAVFLQRLGITLLCTIVQTSAGIWYGASYVPFAQRCLRRTAQSIV
jgi:hypothetical protein